MEQTVKVEDRRLFERFSTRYPAKFKDTRYDYGSNLVIEDSSAYGMKFRTNERLFLHDRITIEVKLPDSENPMLVKGEVVWVKNISYQLWEVGIRFPKLNLMHVARLYKFVSPPVLN